MALQEPFFLVPLLPFYNFEINQNATEFLKSTMEHFVKEPLVRLWPSIALGPGASGRPTGFWSAGT